MIIERLVTRITGFLVRWGLIKHPYGREYAREQYSLTGRHAHDSESRQRSETATVRTRAAMIAVGLVLASLLATGLLFATAT